MTSPPSGSDSDKALAMLHPGLQRELHARGWSALRRVQIDAIEAWRGASSALLISAETAAGKTEAAFLPILSEIALLPRGSVHALYIGPLKALINDQFGRVEELCARLEVPVTRWHGDVSAGGKERLAGNPDGVLLITPESLESILINRREKGAAMFAQLRAIVIDELHAFLGQPRGMHLASLLARLDALAASPGRRARRVGLSATLGDLGAASEFLCPGAGDDVLVIKGDGSAPPAQVRLHAYAPQFPPPGEVDDEADGEDETSRIPPALAADLVTHLAGRASLLFADARGEVEEIADAANGEAIARGLPPTFAVHHGSLSRALRQETESAMRAGAPLTTVCSSTLELGLDLGSVEIVGQYGAPWSVAALRQRLGRSGRREGRPRRMRLYVKLASDMDAGADPPQVQPELLQMIALLTLLGEKWLEPPVAPRLDLSTLMHQVIAVIAQKGSIGAAELHRTLCVEGAFREMAPAMMVRVLRCMGALDIIEQDPRGELLLGLAGERERARMDFYAAFAVASDYEVRSERGLLGRIPLKNASRLEGETILFAASRWLVRRVDERARRLEVEPAPCRGLTPFVGSGGERHARIGERMLEILRGEDEPGFLDRSALDALGAARCAARERDLARRAIVPWGDGQTLMLCWTGTAAQRALGAILAKSAIKFREGSIAMRCSGGAAKVRACLLEHRGLLRDALALARLARAEDLGKFGHWLDDELRAEVIAADYLDIAGAEHVLDEILASTEEPASPR